MYLLLVNGQLIFLFEGGEIAFVEDNPLDEGRQMGYTFGHAFQQFIDLCFRDVLGTRYLMMLWWLLDDSLIVGLIILLH